MALSLCRLPVQFSPPHWFFLSEFLFRKKNPDQKTPNIATICSNSQLIYASPSQRVDGRNHFQRVAVHKHTSGKISHLGRQPFELQTAQPWRLLHFSRSSGRKEQLIFNASRSVSLNFGPWDDAQKEWTFISPTYGRTLLAFHFW